MNSPRVTVRQQAAARCFASSRPLDGASGPSFARARRRWLRSRTVCFAKRFREGNRVCYPQCPAQIEVLQKVYPSLVAQCLVGSGRRAAPKVGEFSNRQSQLFRACPKSQTQQPMPLRLERLLGLLRFAARLLRHALTEAGTMCVPKKTCHSPKAIGAVQMSDSAPQTESLSVKPAPTTFAQKLGCGVMLVIAIVIGLLWWALGNPEERWATREAAMMTMSWPDQVVSLKSMGEPQRSETATRLVDAWLRQPDVPREWHVGRNEKLTKKVRDRTIAMLLESADQPARQAQAKKEAEEARIAAALKYTMFTPPPVAEHLARGGEVWARVAPSEQSLNGTGYRQFWLLSADRKTFVALVTAIPADQSKPLPSQHWYDMMPIGDGVSKPLGGDSMDTYRITALLSATAATLTFTTDSTKEAPDGSVTTKFESVTTFTFPDDPSVPAAVGEERTTSVVLKDAKPLGDPKRAAKREQFHQIKKPNPPSDAGKEKR